MSVVDVLLHVTGLLMWLSWRGVGRMEAAGPAGTILSNLRPVATREERRWVYLVGLLALLLIRALLYRQLGPSLGWHPVWNNGSVHLAFRSDLLPRMFAYSFLGFFWWLYHWYAALILVAVVNRGVPDPDPVTRQVMRALGPLSRWPVLLLLPMPILVLGLSWVGIGFWAVQAQMLPAYGDLGHLLKQASLVSLGGLLAWRWFLFGFYLIAFITNYVYLGRHPFWDFVQETGARLAWPFSWARVHRLDLAPVVGMAVVWLLGLLLAEGWPWWVEEWSSREWPDWLEYGILPTWYRSLTWQPTGP